MPEAIGTYSPFQLELERALRSDLSIKLAECQNVASHLRRWDIETHIARAVEALGGRVQP